MTDLRVRSQKTRQWADALGDADGRVAVTSGGKLEVFSTTTAIALSLATTMKNRTQGRPWRLRRVGVTFSTAPTTSQSITVTQSIGGETGMRPLTVIFSNNPSLTSATSVEYIWDAPGREMFPGDEVTMAYTNTDTRTIKAEIVCEVL